jgi:hypothetical protein
MIRRSLILLVTLWSLVGCLGDNTRDVLLRNGTDLSLTVFPYSQREARFRHDLAPGEVVRENLLVSGTSAGTYVTVMEALDGNGILVFCHKYTYGELTSLRWEVVITPGSNCG